MYKNTIRQGCVRRITMAEARRTKMLFGADEAAEDEDGAEETNPTEPVEVEEQEEVFSEGQQSLFGEVDARRELPSLLRYVAPEGKPSRTEYRILERTGKICKLALRPVTGRTHQLRVHCAYMGWPILGDPQYGSEASLAFSAELGLMHQQLCAKRLEFVHPITGETMSLESNMDAKI